MRFRAVSAPLKWLAFPPHPAAPPEATTHRFHRTVTTPLSCLICMGSGTASPPGAGRAEFAAGLATIAAAVALIAVVPQLRHCVSLVAHGQFTGLRLAEFSSET